MTTDTGAEGSTQQPLLPELCALKIARTRLGFFGICSGPRPGGHFLQYEAWEARECVVGSTVRVLESGIREIIR